MDNGNIQSLEQVKTFQMDVHENTKLVLKYVFGSNKIVTCCSKNNELLIWDAFSENILDKHTLSNSNILPYEFDSTGKLLLGKIESDSNDAQQNAFGLFIWDTNSGKVTSCIWVQCG